MLCLRPFTAADLARLADWPPDPAGAEYLVPPDADWLAYVTHSPGVWAWGAWSAADELLGYAQVDAEGDTGHLAFTVAPGHRGRGIGRALLAALRRQPELVGLEKLMATVEPTNAASRRCLEAAGFRSTGATDADGLLPYCRSVFGEAA